MQQRQAQPASATTATRADRIRRPADGQGRRLPAGAASECSILAYSKAVAATAGPAPRRYFSRLLTRGEHAQQSDGHGKMTAAGHRWPSRSGVGGLVGGHRVGTRRSTRRWSFAAAAAPPRPAARPPASRRRSAAARQSPAAGWRRPGPRAPAAARAALARRAQGRICMSRVRAVVGTRSPSATPAASVARRICVLCRLLTASDRRTPSYIYHGGAIAAGIARGRLS